MTRKKQPPKIKAFKVAITTTEELIVQYSDADSLRTALLEGLPTEQQATADIHIEEITDEDMDDEKPSRF